MIISEFVGAKRMPVMLQTEASDCGLACLAMVACRLGRPVTSARVRSFADSPDLPQTAQDLVRIAKQLGLQGTWYRVRAEDVREFMPSILFWDHHHYVVLTDSYVGGYTVTDPSLGRVYVTCDEFAERYSGRLLAFELGIAPDLSEAMPERRGPITRYLVGLLRTTRSLSRRHIAGWFIVSVWIELTALALPATIPLLLSVRGVGTSQAVRGVLLSTLVALGSLSFLFRYRSERRTQVRARTVLRLQGQVLHGLLHASGEALQRQSLFTLLQAIESSTVVRLLTVVIPSLAADSFATALFGIWLLLRFGVGATSLIAIPLALVAARLSSLPARATILLGETYQFSRSVTPLIEPLSNPEGLHASRGATQVLRRWQVLQARVDQLRGMREELEARFDGCVPVADAILLMGLVAFCAQLPISPSARVNTLGALAVMQALVWRPLTSLSQTLEQLYLARTALSPRFSMLEARRDPLPRYRRPVVGRINIQHLHFRYGEHARWLLRDLALDLSPGARLLVSGPNGIGKTTLLYLLAGVLQPTTGRICLDGIDLSSWRRSSLCAAITYVPERPLLQPGTVFDNLTLGRGKHTQAEVERVLHEVGFPDVLGISRSALHAELQREYSSLSHSALQALAVARALLGSPRVILLDEPLVGCDDDQRDRLFAVLSDSPATLVVVSHDSWFAQRLSQTLVLTPQAPSLSTLPPTRRSIDA